MKKMRGKFVHLYLMKYLLSATRARRCVQVVRKASSTATRKWYMERVQWRRRAANWMARPVTSCVSAKERRFLLRTLDQNSVERQ
jgi:hypothetical protein